MRETLAKYFYGDKIIWIVIAFLTIISVVSVYSSIGDLAYRTQGGDTSHVFLGHLKFIVAGFIVLYVVHRVPYKNFYNISAIFIIIAVFLLIATLAFGKSTNSAIRWLTLPGTNIKFQTSELAKVALIAYISRVLSGVQGNAQALDDAFKKIMVVVVIICGLILPANFSTAMLVFLNSIILMFIGRIPTKKILASVGILIVSGLIIIGIAFAFPQVGRFKTWTTRIETFFNGGDADSNRQSDLSKAAVATSGPFGKIPGNSSVRYSLPQAYSDFIFAIIIEGWGPIVGIFVLLAYLALLYRTGLIVKASSRTFPAFLAIGLIVNIVFQAFVNMAVAVGVLPVTGQTLPIVSMGGTSQLITYMSLGVILSISRSLNSSEGLDNGETISPDINIAK